MWILSNIKGEGNKLDSFSSEFCQTFEKNNSLLCTLLKKYKKIFLTFVWVYHNADAKPDKDITKYNHKPMSLMNINAKILNEC